MLRRVILYIRQKPKSVRDSYAFVLAGTLTTAVALIWVWNWPSMIEGRQYTPDGESSAPLSDFLDKAKDQVANARQSVDLESLSEVVPADPAAAGGVSVQSAINSAAVTTSATSTTPPPIRVVTTTTTSSATTTR